MLIYQWLNLYIIKFLQNLSVNILQKLPPIIMTPKKKIKKNDIVKLEIRNIFQYEKRQKIWVGHNTCISSNSLIENLHIYNYVEKYYILTFCHIIIGAVVFVIIW